MGVDVLNRTWVAFEEGGRHLVDYAILGTCIYITILAIEGRVGASFASRSVMVRPTQALVLYGRTRGRHHPIEKTIIDKKRNTASIGKIITASQSCHPWSGASMMRFQNN